MSNEVKIRPLGFAAKLAVRTYLAIMRIEALSVLPLRRWLIGKITAQPSAMLNVFAHVFIEGFEGLRIGNRVSINRDSNLSCFGGVTIGDNVAIGHGTSIISTNHGFTDRETPINYQPVDAAPVVIGSNVWIGARVTILAGVTIPSGTVIAAGAVVTRSIAEPDMIVAGVPARVIKSRFA
ncbi:MAG: acyltransferase [Pseudomonadota bacterium]|nr:acyltransferase [Pseudomonadota bacterium]